MVPGLSRCKRGVRLPNTALAARAHERAIRSGMMIDETQKVSPATRNHAFSLIERSNTSGPFSPARPKSRHTPLARCTFACFALRRALLRGRAMDQTPSMGPLVLLDDAFVV
eukprot:3064286-Prymnesium_polylepis.2